MLGFVEESEEPHRLLAHHFPSKVGGQPVRARAFPRIRQTRAQPPWPTVADSGRSTGMAEPGGPPFRRAARLPGHRQADAVPPAGVQSAADTHIAAASVSPCVVRSHACVAHLLPGGRCTALTQTATRPSTVVSTSSSRLRRGGWSRSLRLTARAVIFDHYRMLCNGRHATRQGRLACDCAVQRHAAETARRHLSASRFAGRQSCAARRSKGLSVPAAQGQPLLFQGSGRCVLLWTRSQPTSWLPAHPLAVSAAERTRRDIDLFYERLSRAPCGAEPALRNDRSAPRCCPCVSSVQQLRTVSSCQTPPSHRGACTHATGTRARHAPASPHAPKRQGRLCRASEHQKSWLPRRYLGFSFSAGK